jgi:uncharacterized protein
VARKLFINLPVRDLPASIRFYTALGFAFNPQFTDETATCMILGEDNFAMLLTHAKFASFAPKPIADETSKTAHLIAITCESKTEVDAMLMAALAAGGKEPNPARDYGFMYQRCFEDPDGHVWEPFWMDPGFVTPQ